MNGLDSLKTDLLAWAGLHRGKEISEQVMPRFHELIDRLDNLTVIWEIAQSVFDSEPGVASEVDGSVSCFYCNGDQYDGAGPKVTIGNLHHEPDCAYVKAHFELREEQ